MTEAKTNIIKPAIYLGLALFVIFGLVWWKSVYSNPRDVFPDMLNNSLRLRGLTRTVSQQSNGQQVEQIIRAKLTHDRAARALTDLNQPDSSSRVVTENIGTVTDDYVRYNHIETAQRKDNGDPIDFTSILNVWGLSGSNEDRITTDGELYNEAALGVVPFGMLNRDQRRQLLTKIDRDNIYDVDYENVDREIRNGRPVYTYKVSLDMEKYLELLKIFATFTGMNHMSNIDPASYADEDRLGFELSVDVWSRQLVHIKYGAGERQEKISGFNASHPILLPKDPISVQELQKRLQELR